MPHKTMNKLKFEQHLTTYTYRKHRYLCIKMYFLCALCSYVVQKKRGAYRVGIVVNKNWVFTTYALIKVAQYFNSTRGRCNDVDCSTFTWTKK